MKKRKHWTFSDWHRNDPAGLNKMKETEPEKYKALYNQQFKYGFKHTLDEMMNWSFNDFLAKDQAGLQWIKETHPGFYKQLYEQQYGNQAANEAGL